MGVVSCPGNENSKVGNYDNANYSRIMHLQIIHINIEGGGGELRLKCEAFESLQVQNKAC